MPNFLNRYFVLHFFFISGLLNASDFGQRLTWKNFVLIREAFNFQFNYGSEIWPRWEKAKYPLLFKTEKYDYLIYHPNPGSDFPQKYYDVNLKDTVRFRANADTLDYYAALPVNGSWTIVMNEPEQEDDAGLWILKFAHECFHLFQADMSKDRVVNPFTDEYSKYNELNFPFDYDNKVIRSALRLEGEVIFNSTTDSLKSLKYSISKKLFNHCQTVFQSLFHNKNSYEYKQWMEWNEGVAKYTEDRLARLAKKSFRAETSDEFRKEFPGVNFNEIWQNNYKNSLNPIRFIGEGVNGRVMFYYSGMGKAYYLDKLYNNWKEEYFLKNLDQLILQ